MAHDIDMSNNRVNYAFARNGGAGWHGLDDNPLDPNATIEEWIAASGLDFTIDKAPVQYCAGYDAAGSPIMLDMPGRVVLHRSDTKKGLSVMSDRYIPHQPEEIARFFASVCEQANLTLETMGALADGAKYWAMARIGDGACLAGDKAPTMPYVMLSTSCDGTLATTGAFTATRVVCNNTLNYALRTTDGESIKQGHRSSFDADAMAHDLNLADFDANWRDHVNQMARLQEIEISPDQATAFFAELLRPTPKPKAIAAPVLAITDQTNETPFNALMGGNIQAPNIISGPVDATKIDRKIRGLDALERSYFTAPGAVPGTGYGLVQGVTHFVDHVRGSDDARRKSAWFGQGADIKARAVEQALELANL